MRHRITSQFDLVIIGQLRSSIRKKVITILPMKSNLLLDGKNGMISGQLAPSPNGQWFALPICSDVSQSYAPRTPSISPEKEPDLLHQHQRASNTALARTCPLTHTTFLPCSTILDPVYLLRPLPRLRGVSLRKSEPILPVSTFASVILSASSLHPRLVN